MLAKNLEKGKWYLYRAGAEPVPVKYLHETLNGYLFTDGQKENELHRLTVAEYVEDIN